MSNVCLDHITVRNQYNRSSLGDASPLGVPKLDWAPYVLKKKIIILVLYLENWMSMAQF